MCEIRIGKLLDWIQTQTPDLLDWIIPLDWALPTLQRNKTRSPCYMFDMFDTCGSKLAYFIRVFDFFIRNGTSSQIFRYPQSFPTPQTRVGGGQPGFNPQSGMGVGKGLPKGQGLLPTPDPQPHVKWGYTLLWTFTEQPQLCKIT